MTTIDKESILEAFNAVRDDSNEEAQWCVLKYEGNEIILDSMGGDYEEWVSKFAEDERAFGFIRVTTGDEMSKRAKFALVTWVGPNVSPLKKAKMSTDKGIVKTVIHSFAAEIYTDESSELDVDYIREQLIKAGGANYGTGQRD